jgi:hypothetical protein
MYSVEGDIRVARRVKRPFAAGSETFSKRAMYLPENDDGGSSSRSKFVRTVAGVVVTNVQCPGVTESVLVIFCSQCNHW